MKPGDRGLNNPRSSFRLKLEPGELRDLKILMILALLGVFSVSWLHFAGACSPDLLIAAVFDDGDPDFSFKIAALDKLLRTLALPISQKKPYEFTPAAVTEIRTRFAELFISFPPGNPPKIIYDPGLWKDYHTQLTRFGDSIGSLAAKGDGETFHGEVQKIEDLFTMIYRNRGKRDHRLLYPHLKPFRKNPSSLSASALAEMRRKLGVILGMMTPQDETEQRIHDLIKELEVIVASVEKALTGDSVEFRVTFSQALSEVLRIENGILNLRWFSSTVR